MIAAGPDAEGLLASLVIAPGTFPRNRFYSMFRAAPQARVRARAAELRGVVRTLLGARGTAQLESRTEIEGGVCLVVRVPRLGLVVTTHLDAFETAVVDVAVSIGRRVPPPGDAKARVDAALVRLAPALPSP